MSAHPSKDHIFISKLTEIILANLGNENFGVNELVLESGISHYSLNRRLQAITSKSIKHFIREVRLQKALEMLQNEEVHVSEVAYKVGFGSPAYFNTCFHEFFGFPPGAVRKGDYTGPEETKPEHLQDKQTKNFRKTVFLVLSGILVTAAFAYLIYHIFFISSFTVTGISANKREKSIAVLPFKNLGDTDVNQHFIDGVMEEILGNLSKIHELRVVSRTSAEQYRNNLTKSLPEIARELKVNYIVEGSGQKDDNNFILRVQLIKARKKETHLWAESYTRGIREPKDVFSIQSTIAQSIAEKLRAVITPEEKKLIEKTPTISLTALNYYQKGRDEFEKYLINNNNREYLSRADHYFRRALEYDPEYSQAYTGLATVYKNNNIRREYFSENYLDSVMILADIALRYDDKASAAYILKGDYYSEKGDQQRALEEYNRAININPNSWEAYWGRFNLSVFDDNVNWIYDCNKAASLVHGPERQMILRSFSGAFIQFGFLDLASKYYLEILELYGDSLSYLIDLGGLEYSRGNYDKSIEYLEKAYKTDPTRIILNYNVNVFSALGELNMLIRHFEESLKWYKKLIDILKARGEINYNNMHRIGYAYLKNGYLKEANFYFNMQMDYCNKIIESDRPRKTNAYYDRAGVFAQIGDKEKAYTDLRIVNQSQIQGLWMINLMKADPLFASIRNEPEFQNILDEMEARYQAEHERVKKWLEEQGMQ